MLQFSIHEMASIKRKATTSTIAALKRNNEVVLNNDVLVPVDGRATWNLYYFCPEHGVRLTWNRHKPKSHCCPVDGKEFTGEPYDGAWWRWLNGLNAKACYDLGLLWHLTDDPIYLDKVREILLAYATYYPDYEVHGGVPYNGPGKANAQTLCEANCHMDLARGYGFIKQALSSEQQQKIEGRLLREGAEFLIEQRTNQVHNHEMKINATIGVIGLILDEPSYLDFALNTDYGIHYQLNHGSVGDGMWYEGSIHYHYYALQALQNFEKLARNTPYSVSVNPNYLKMMKYPLRLVMNTGEFPRLNDCITGQEKLTHAHLFEFAYKQYPCAEFARALGSIYRNISRDNIDALLYGVDELPSVRPLDCKPTHCAKVGITIALDETRNNAMLLKHTPYGGEHDHYDRLGLILTRDGKEILPDLGTTGYGAELHYGYYKNTATHNTLVVNQCNQSPIDPRLLSYQQSEGFTLVDTLADWSQPQATVDSHTIVQWDLAAYRDVSFRRIMLWLGDCAVELNVIGNPYQQQLDLTYHVRGKHKQNPQSAAIANPLQGALARMTETYLVQGQQCFSQGYTIEGQSDYHQHVAVDSQVDVLTGYAPDNPATSDLAYTLIRSRQLELKVAIVHDLSKPQNVALKSVNWTDNSIEFVIQRGSKIQAWRYCLTSFELSFQ
ncbi:heparinase II/III domain-containing protein [Vibrio gallicus]|uniref:heparinase II/III domain-containing protein n=1 Tax=Vibrio gallicus TaxID=190897 RepID=UPI0021C2919A|nr:heparinase II/III family protein [Vibrio gallicus]